MPKLEHCSVIFMKHIIQDKKKVGTFEIVLDPQAGKHSAAGGLSESETQVSVR